MTLSRWRGVERGYDLNAMVERTPSEGHLCVNPRNFEHLKSTRSRVKSWVRVAVFSVSTLAGVAISMLFVLSHYKKLEWSHWWESQRQKELEYLVVFAKDGSVRVAASWYTSVADESWTFGVNPWYSGRNWYDFGVLSVISDGHAVLGVVFPLWFPAVLCLTCSFLVIRKPFRRWRRRKRGRCETCGYDLTGNMSGTCSECGSRAG